MTKIIHEWVRVWSKQDYANHNQDLYNIGVEYKECQRLADESRELNPKLFASDYFQIKNKGLTDKLEYMYDEVKNSNGEEQNYEVNRAKLEKYQNWVSFNTEKDELVLKARFDTIKDMVSKIKMS